MANEKFYYIEKCYSLTKEDYFSPWLMKYSNPLDDKDLISVYITNKYNEAGTVLNEIPIIKIGPDFQYILDSILPNITTYPYSWPLEGIKIDINGYDFKCVSLKNDNNQQIEIVSSARTLVWEYLNIIPETPATEMTTNQSDEVSAGFLTKLQLTFAKAGPISTIALDYYSLEQMNLLSIVYYSDITRYVPPVKLNMDLVSYQQDGYTLYVNLAKPIFARRLILVLGQSNASQNSYSFNRRKENNDIILNPRNSQETNDSNDGYWSKDLTKSINDFENDWGLR